MKKKMMLVNYEFTTGDEKFKQSQIVSLRFEGTVTEEQEKRAAVDALIAWFSKTYPESDIQSVVPWPTIYADIQGSNDKPMVPFGWFKNDHKPFVDFSGESEEGDISDLVLIDIDGKRDIFVTGKWHFPFKDREGWWQTDEDFEDAIVPEFMRWSYLPLAKYDKR
jgi:hypothetical protein